jgi:6-phosphogluconolactonase
MIEVYADHEAMSRAAAELFSTATGRAEAAHGRFVVLLSGGETPRRLYELLAEEPHKYRVPWERGHIFWVDERCVPPEDPRSNVRMARRALLDRVPVPASQIYPIAGDHSPRQAAAEYAVLLENFFAGAPPRFDLVLLGLGEDGHTASLFPDSAALDEKEQWTVVSQRPGEELRRISLTAPLINQAALVVFLVTGKGKAAVLREVLEGEPDPRQRPARLINPTHGGTLLWLVDRAAARLLRSPW